MIELDELSYLSGINSPADLSKLSNDDLDKLADEIRQYLVSVVSRTGGHLASNLGVVEITIALHRVFDFERDRLVFDVGHQSYVHKLLTGRVEKFDALRKRGGIAGFPKTEESVYDAFNTGHSSTSLSAAIGMLRADCITGNKRSVVAVIGDGALTGGMAYEALDDVGHQRLPLIVILNDNEMSIAGNVGGMSRHLMKMRSSRRYNGFKRRFSGALKKIPLVGNGLSNALERLKNRIKYFILPNVLFEELGFTYLGPVDGHNIVRMTEVLESVRNTDRPVVIHAITRKGKGYEPAERDPEKFHGVGKFNKETGETASSNNNSKEFVGTLIELAKTNQKIVAITAAMASGTGLEMFGERYPERFFDVGIAEQHAVTMAAGMAISGILPVFCVYSSFLQRGYDQLLHDVCLQKLKVVLGVDRAGLVGADGETHHGIYDIAYMLSLPNMTILSPATVNELHSALKYAVNECGTACSIRYNRGLLWDRNESAENIDPLEWECIQPVRSVSVIATGRLVERAVRACDGLNVGMYNARSIRPMDEKSLKKLMRSHYIITLEDGICDMGFGTQVAAWMNKNGSGAEVIRLGVPNRVIEQGSVDQQDEECGISLLRLREMLNSMLGGSDVGTC